MRDWVLLGALAGAAGCYTGVHPDAGGTDSSASGPDSGEGGDGDDGTGTDSDGEADIDPGRVTLHRLNRAEYNNTIRDLFFGLDVSPADQFPADDHSLGFDNIADSLNVTPLLFELYERAADTTLEEALRVATDPGQVQRHEAETIGSDVGAECCDGFWNLSSAGEIEAAVDIETEGTYELRIAAAGQQAGPELPNMAVRVDGLDQGSFDVDAELPTAAEYVVEISLAAGTHIVTMEFTNDFYDAGTGDDRNLLIDYLDVVPLDGPVDGSEIRDMILVCEPEGSDDEDCNREIIETFVERAWRRPVTDDELDGLALFVDQGIAEGGTWEDGIILALKAALVSPHFIFRVELDPDPESPEPHPLSEWELASRLSYFLWSSMPDDDLFAAARSGDLTDPAEIEAQVRRMLKSPKANALVANFAGQWLYTRALTTDLVKDYQTYPEWDEELLDSMRGEMEHFIQTFVSDGRDLRELLTAKNTFVNDRLAQFYGLAPVGTDDFVEVSTMGQPRKGILTQAGLMSVLSHPNVTSPVKRGKWILEQLLCIEPPPPPPGVEATVDPSFDEGPMRQRLEQHREDPSCAVCHAQLDPVGLALENYDGVGAWRDMEGPWEIDASGEMPSPLEGSFNNALEMAEFIAASEQFAHCTTEKALIYGLGRGLSDEDEEQVAAIATGFAEGGMQLEELFVQIALSDVFRMRRGEPQ